MRKIWQRLSTSKRRKDWHKVLVRKLYLPFHSTGRAEGRARSRVQNYPCSQILNLRRGEDTYRWSGTDNRTIWTARSSN